MDGYRWYQNGTKRIPNSDPKVHFSLSLPSGNTILFKKCAVFLLDTNKKAGKCVLLHYIGDDSLAIDRPHGSSKKNYQDYFRTCPSVMKRLALLPNLPGNLYKDAIANSDCPSAQHPIMMPRNSIQISNIQKRQRSKQRLSHDALYNLHELAYYDLDDFVHIIKTFPDLIVICGLKKMVKELNPLLQRIFLLTIVVVVVFSATGCWCITNLK